MGVFWSLEKYWQVGHKLINKPSCSILERLGYLAWHANQTNSIYRSRSSSGDNFNFGGMSVLVKRTGDVSGTKSLFVG